jgi:hypothetical protein
MQHIILMHFALCINEDKAGFLNPIWDVLLSILYKNSDLKRLLKGGDKKKVETLLFLLDRKKPYSRVVNADC